MKINGHEISEDQLEDADWALPSQPESQLTPARDLTIRFDREVAEAASHADEITPASVPARIILRNQLGVDPAEE